MPLPDVRSGEAMVAALYVHPRGVYAGLPGVELWDEQRDARRYAGPYPVVAHPPCERWSQMNRVNAARWGYSIGEDGGCFAAALRAVRTWGGVLEHPAESMAFRHYNLPKPRRGGWQRTIDGDWVTEVNQAAYGHKAAKRTWLLCAGLIPPRLDWRPIRGTHQIGGFDRTLPDLPRHERAATPPAFRDLLLGMARSVVARVEVSA